MKSLLHSALRASRFALASAALMALLAFITPPAKAADFALDKTFWSVANFTNNTGTATNLAQAMDCQRVADFSLEVRTGNTNPSAGSLSIFWETSNTGNWLVTNTPALTGSAGWFSVPLTNSGTKTIWTTNITVGPTRYWRISWVTNQVGQHMTNVFIAGYVKPQRTSRDY